MKRLTKEELEILENAPRGATHYMELEGCGSEYAIKDNGKLKEVGSLELIFTDVWDATELSDLRKRKEQEDKQKKIVDAVAELGVNLPDVEGDEATQVIVEMRDFDEFKIGQFCTGNSVRDNSYWNVVCTADEFNQCVKEMSLHAGEVEFLRYRANILNRVASEIKESATQEPLEWVNGELVDCSELGY